MVNEGQVIYEAPRSKPAIIEPFPEAPPVRREDEPEARNGIVVDYILDLETESWDRFVLGGLYDVKLDKMEFFRHDEDDRPESVNEEYKLVERLLALADDQIFDEKQKRRPVTIWAHNGGRYDVLWLCDWLVKLGVEAKVFASSARITLINIGKFLAIRDSAGLVPMSLEQGAKIGHVLKSKTGLPCKCCKTCCKAPEGAKVAALGLEHCRRLESPGGFCGGDCGGYCSIARDMIPSYWTLMKSYLETDCKANASMLVVLEDFAIAKDLDLRGTVGSSAWATAKRRYNLPGAKWDAPTLYNQAREGYYGGRTQVFRPVSRHGWRFDVNAAYIAALASISLPHGKASSLGPEDAERAWGEEKEGVYQATVEIDPRTHVPPLPWRAKDGRLHYPTGRFSGSWTRKELSYALSLGADGNDEVGSCKLVSFGPAIIWERSSPLMSTFASLAWSLRDHAGKGAPIGKWLKWFGNSATGKLAQRPENEECMLAPANPKPCPGGDWCGGGHDLVALEGSHCGDGKRCCDHQCHRTCGRYDALDKNGTVWTRQTWKIPDNGHVQWAAYLTAHARICLHRQLVADGQGGRTCVYCDTDSCYSETERTENVGKALGQWLFEGHYDHFNALAPKTYSYFDETGKRQVRAKGMFEPDWDKLVAHEPIPIDRGAIQFRSAVRAGLGLFRRRNFTRSSLHEALETGAHFGDRLYDAEHGYTMPAIMGNADRLELVTTEEKPLS